MKDLNKYNTALDLSKLNDNEYEEICILSNSWSTFGKFLMYNKLAKKYLHNVNLYRRVLLVDFQTFKQIHFNAKTS